MKRLAARESFLMNNVLRDLALWVFQIAKDTSMSGTRHHAGRIQPLIHALRTKSTLADDIFF